MVFQLLFVIFSSLYAQQPLESKYSEAILISDNNSAFSNILHDISQSKKAIEMHYYIFNLDKTGSIIANELVEKAKVGVKVYLVVDQFINIKNINYYKAMIKFAGPNMQIYLVSKKSENKYFWHELFHYCVVNELESQKLIKNKAQPSSCGELNIDGIKSIFSILFSQFYDRSHFKKLNITRAIYANANSDYNRAKEVLLKKWIKSLSSDFSIYKIIIKKILTLYIGEAKDLSAGMHSKYLNIDDEVLYVGGRNIADEYLSSNSQKFVFSDVDVRVNTVDPKFSYDLDRLKKDRKIEFTNVNNYSDFQIIDRCLSKSSFKEYMRCDSDDMHFFDISWLKKMKDVGKTKLPIGKFELKFQTFSDKNLIGKVIEKKLNDSCSTTLISPYLMPSYLIRKSIFQSLNRKCNVQLITNAFGYTDFNIVNLFGIRSLRSLSKLKSDNLGSDLITYWGKSNLHMKLVVTNNSLIIMSSNLNLRMIENEVNNFIHLKFEKQLNTSQLVEELMRNGSFTIGNASEMDVTKAILKDFGLQCVQAECQAFQSLIDEVLEYIKAIEVKEYRSRFSDNHSILDTYFDML